jgi:hypothetical protein
MARGYSKAGSEIRYFNATTTGGSSYDPNDEDAYDMDRDARAEGYDSWLDKERAEGVEPRRTVTAREHMDKYIAGGEKIKSIIAGLTPEQAKDYKELRKLAIKAFEEGEDAKKTAWKAENPGKEDYAGKPRRFMVRAGLEAADKALFGEGKPEAKPTESLMSGDIQRTLYKWAMPNDGKAPLRALVMARLAYEKDAFLRVKGHFSTPDAKPYGHIKTPWVDDDLMRDSRLVNGELTLKRGEDA